MSGVYDKEIWGDDFLIVPTIIRAKAHRAFLNKDIELLNKIKNDFKALFLEFSYKYEKTKAN